MDCKRFNQYSALKKFLSIVCLMAVMSCTWVKDDNDDCPYGFWLQLHYSYNILDVEAAPKYVTDAYVYVYDADGKYVKRIYADKNALMSSNYRVRVEGLTEGDYQFVVWSGLGSSQYAVSGDGQTMGDFRLSLAVYGTQCSENLSALYHGSLSLTHYDDSYAVHDVELMKNTNQLSCLVVPETSGITLDPADFNMSIVSANGIMNVYNQLVADSATTYLPFEKTAITVNDGKKGTLSGIRFNISTLRLTSDTDCLIKLERVSTGATLFDKISLSEQLGKVGTLYTNLDRPLTVPEYLDRQDFYTIVFILSDDLQMLMDINVTSWRVRAENHLKIN